MTQKLYTEHPLYAEIKADLELVRLFYLGSKEVLEGDPNKVLFKFDREEADLFKDRQKTLYYLNILKPIIDHGPSFILGAGFNKKIPESIKHIVDSLEYHSAYERALTLAEMHGVSWLQVDKPRAEIKTLADQLANPSYINVWSAEQVVDWDMNPDFSVNWVKTLSTDPSRGTPDNPTSGGYILTIWTKDTVTICKGKSTSDFKAVETLPNPLAEYGVVPFVPLFKKQPVTSSPYTDNTSIQMAKISRRILNSQSEMTTAIRSSCFSVLLYPVGPEVDLSQGLPEITIGNKQALYYKQIGAKPEFLEAGTTPVEVTLKEQENLIKEIFNLAKINQNEAKNLITASQIQSITQGQMRQYKALSRQGEIAENKILKLLLMMEGSPNESFECHWPMDFSTSLNMSNFQESQQVLKETTSPTLKKELHKSLARKTITLPQSKWEVIDAEIDTADTILDQPENANNTQL